MRGEQRSEEERAPFHQVSVSVCVAGPPGVVPPMVPHHCDGLLHKGSPHHSAVEDDVLRGGGAHVSSELGEGSDLW